MAFKRSGVRLPLAPLVTGCTFIYLSLQLFLHVAGEFFEQAIRNIHAREGFTRRL